MSKTTRLPYLDGIRGLASLMVALSHFVLAFESTLFNGDRSQSHFAAAVALSQTGLVFFYNPDLGVPIFFVLSGFVLANSMDADRPSWPVIATRRWVRLCLPVLATSLLIDLAMHLGAFHNARAASIISKSPWLREMYPSGQIKISILTILRNAAFTFLTGTTGDIGRLNPVLWTMPIELLGSLGLFAVYAFGAGLFRRTSWGGLVIAIVSMALTWKTLYQGFGCGITLFEIYRACRRLPTKLQLKTRWLVCAWGLTTLTLGIWLGSTPFIIAGSYLEFLKFCYRHGFYITSVDMHHAGATLSSPPCYYYPHSSAYFPVPSANISAASPSCSISFKSRFSVVWA